MPLTILPLGTENLLARHLGIPCNGQFVAEVIAQGVTRRIDTGLLNGKRFTLMVFEPGLTPTWCIGPTPAVREISENRITSNPFWKRCVLTVIRDAGRRGRGGSHPQEGVSARAIWALSQVPLSGRLVVVRNLPEYALWSADCRQCRR